MSKNKKVESGTSLESAVKKCGVDLKTWDIESYSTKELASGEFLFTIYFKRKKEESTLDLSDIARHVSKIAPRVENIKYPKKERGLLAEIGIYDLHVGKLSHKDQTGSNYDIKIAAKTFRSALDYKISQLKKFPVERILFPLGNDFYQVDNEQDTTTGGTKQDTDKRFHKMFREGSKLIIEAINKLQEVAPVDCYVIHGNHARITEFLLGEVLLAYYNNNPNVTIDNTPTPRKYYTFGKNLIGLTHGDEIKLPVLPMLMASERPVEWGHSKWRFFKLGHFHHQKVILDDIGSVIVEVVPSLTGIDLWHKKKGYCTNTRAAVTSIYDKEDGLISKIFYNHKE